MRFTLVPVLLSCVLAAGPVPAPAQYAAHAEELDNVSIPKTMQANGKTLHLNGYGLRTYSFLGIHIYIASLYLEHSCADSDEIIRSGETKLLMLRFQHDVSADEARKAWREGLADNCEAPCHLDSKDVDRFLAMVPATHVGDNYAFIFHEHGVTVTVGKHLVGAIGSPHFARAMLAVFLGPRPASPRLKQDLLNRHE